MKKKTPKWEKGNFIQYMGYKWDKITNIEWIGYENTLNFTVEKIHEYNSLCIISKNSGGGVGINFSKLRAKDTPLSTGGTSSGVVSFIKGFDEDDLESSNGELSELLRIADFTYPEKLKFMSKVMKYLKEQRVVLDCTRDFV